MELMKTSFDKFYKKVAEDKTLIPEKVLGKISFAVSWRKFSRQETSILLISNSILLLV